MEMSIDRSKLEELRTGLRGVAYAPGEQGYDEARKVWNLNAHQHPALVVMAAGAADVIAAVRLARDAALGVGVMATGHGVASPCDGGDRDGAMRYSRRRPGKGVLGRSRNTIANAT